MCVFNHCSNTIHVVYMCVFNHCSNTIHVDYIFMCRLRVCVCALYQHYTSRLRVCVFNHCINTIQVCVCVCLIMYQHHTCSVCVFNHCINTIQVDYVCVCVQSLYQHYTSRLRVCVCVQSLYQHYTCSLYMYVCSIIVSTLYK